MEERDVTSAGTESAPGEKICGALRRTNKGIARLCGGIAFVLLCTVAGAGHAQTVALQNQQGSEAAAQAEAPETQLVYPPKPAEQTGAPQTITFSDALQRAQKYNAEFLSAQSDQRSAREDRVQARNARLPQFSAHSEYIGTQGNGITPNGRYVTNDGVHVYREWAVMRQDISANSILGTDYKKSQAAEAIATAKAEIARRGLTVTVTKAYYGLVVAQRKYATQQQALEQARRFLQITQDEERVGQAAHSDVVKAQIQYNQQETGFSEANLGMESARLDLAVLISPVLDENFTAVDDLDQPRPLPAFGEAQEMAGKMNPDIRVATETLRSTKLEVTASKTAFLPVVSFNPVWGLEANCVALDCVYTSIPEAGATPTLGYMITATLDLPIWDWGTLRSKLHQANLKQAQAQVQLTQTQRQVVAELYAAYNEALVSRDEVQKLRETADLAAESLRLVTLRYQAGESTALDVTDAQSTLVSARNAYDDSEVRYRTALATLQTFTGAF